MIYYAPVAQWIEQETSKLLAVGSIPTRGTKHDRYELKRTTVLFLLYLSLMEYDFFIAGRWRNKDNIAPVLEIVRNAGRTAYCFIENEYPGEKVELKLNSDPEIFMAQMENLSQEDPFVRQIFEVDIDAERKSKNFLLVLPAGIAGHIEAGAAYGMGKKCYAVGELEKTETLYCIFEKIFKDTHELQSWLKESNPIGDSLVHKKVSN